MICCNTIAEGLGEEEGGEGLEGKIVRRFVAFTDGPPAPDVGCCSWAYCASRSASGRLLRRTHSACRQSRAAGTAAHILTDARGQMPVIKSPRPTAVDQSPTNPDRKPHPGQKAHLDNLPQPSQLHRAPRSVRIDLALLQRDISRPVFFRVRSPFSGVLRVGVEVEQVLILAVDFRLKVTTRVERTYA